MLKTRRYFYGVILGLLLFQSAYAQERPTGNGIPGPIVCLAIGTLNKYAGTATGVYVSTREGNDWKAISSGLTNTNVRTLQFLSDSASTLVAGTEGGIFVSSNSGFSWEERSKGLSNKNVWSLTIFGARWFAGTNSGGVYLSTDRGASWSAINNGIPADAFVYSLSVSGGTLYAGTSQGIFASRDNGASWSKQ